MPKFRKEHPEKRCDVVIVDGGHSRFVATQDVLNFRNLTGPDNFVIFDNYPDAKFGKRLSHAWEGAKKAGVLQELFRCQYRNDSHGFTVGRYIH